MTHGNGAVGRGRVTKGIVGLGCIRRIARGSWGQRGGAAVGQWESGQ
jgi:hypothetical protein